MHTRGRRLLSGFLALGAVCALALLAALLSSSSAQAAITPRFTLAFDGLVPGTPESRTGTFLLERDATLSGFAWLERQGVMVDAAIGVTICDAAGACVDPTSVTGTAFVSGPVEVTVTAELAADTVAGAAGSVIGQVTFTADDALAGTGTGPAAGLAATGTDAAVWLAVLAAVLAGGALLVALGRGASPPSAARRSPVP